MSGNARQPGIGQGNGAPVGPRINLPPLGKWAAHGGCINANPEMFSPAADGRIPVSDMLRAAQICSRCPVRSECGAEADDLGYVGIWGGVLRNASDSRVDLVARIGDSEWWAEKSRAGRHLKVVGE